MGFEFFFSLSVEVLRCTIYVIGVGIEGWCEENE